MRTIDLTSRADEARAATGADNLPTSPGAPAVVVTCIDARVDPAHLFGLAPGEASVFRNIGGRLTDSTIEQIGILAGLGKLIGGEDMELDVALVHHTECGAARFSMPPVRAKAAATAGVEPADVEALAIDDPTESVRADIDRLAASSLPVGLNVSGYVYDVETGALAEVRSTTTLGAVAGSDT